MSPKQEFTAIAEKLRRISAGDEEAFRELYLDYYDRLYQFARLYLNNAETAEDIVSELFYQLWKSRSTLPRIGNFNAYVYRAVRNSCTNSLKSSNRNLDCDITHPELQISVDPAQLADEAVDYRMLNRVLTQAVEELPERCRQIFKLSREDGLSHREIASVLEIALTTVEGQLAIAKRRLKAAAEPYLKKN